MESKRQIQISEEIAHATSTFIARESNRDSLITVTRTELSPDGRRATIFLSVLPESREAEALLFAQRRTTDLRDYLYRNTRFGHLPHLTFQIDGGEKNRLRVDELTRKI